MSETTYQYSPGSFGTLPVGDTAFSVLSFAFDQGDLLEVRWTYETDGNDDTGLFETAGGVSETLNPKRPPQGAVYEGTRAQLTLTHDGPGTVSVDNILVHGLAISGPVVLENETRVFTKFVKGGADPFQSAGGDYFYQSPSGDAMVYQLRGTFAGSTEQTLTANFVTSHVYAVQAGAGKGGGVEVPALKPSFAALLVGSLCLMLLLRQNRSSRSR